jgi:hypothetical protein
MGTAQTLNGHSTGVARKAAAGLFGLTIVLTVVLVSALAVAQEAAPSGTKPAADENVFESIGRWFAEQSDKLNSSFKGFGQEAGMAAKATVDNAKDAADAVSRIPSARMMAGHVKCKNAPNGAPDCLAAATALCKEKGFGSGKSMDMTTAEVCPPQVYLSGRSSGPGCRTETFVSRALCQ